MIHKQRLNNRILSLVLALVMVLGMLPMSAFAADNSTALIITGGTDYTYENGVLDIIKAGTYEIKNADPTTATTDAIRVSAASGEVIVKLSGVNIRPDDKPAFEITGDCETTVILKDGTEKTLDNYFRADTFAGLQNGEKTLVITCEGAYTDNHMCSDTCGKLTARSYDGAGIGGEYQGNGSNITISGGIVTATSVCGAGIGGGNKGNGSNITITGGTVTATSEAGAGIGGGEEGDGSNITISGGTVTATGDDGAGIGGGDEGDGSNITISGGTVEATSAWWGAGIGGGKGGDGSNITISGGTVTATSATWGAGIGGGDSGNGSNITISGGTVTATSATWGAGIGGGYAGNGSNITISGGTVTATSDDGAGIGNGYVVIGSGYVSPAENIKIAPAANTEITVNTGATAANATAFVFAIEMDITGLVSGNAYFYSVAAAHNHNFSYAPSGTVITETCTCDHSETATIVAPTDLTFDGNAKEATVTYSADWQGGELAVNYSGNNINAGNVTASITKGGATASVTYKVLPKQITELTLEGLNASYEYAGALIVPEFTVKDGNTTLTEGADYVVMYSNNSTVGTATLLVILQGNYEGMVTRTFEITGDASQGVGIAKIEKTDTNGLVDTYTITYTDGSTTTFTVTNGKDGVEGIQGKPGEDGHTPIITIQNGYWYVDGVNTNVKAEGVKGDTGNGISSIEKTGTSGLVDTYTITFTDGSTTTFTVTNGEDGKDGADGKDGITPQLRINETTNMWEVSYDNGKTWTSLGVKATGENGKDGADGKDGANGADGKDGLTPFIGENGNWWIGDTDTGVQAAYDGNIPAGSGAVVENDGNNTITIIAIVIACLALASNIALVAWAVTKKKKSLV